jgi:membrane protease YdiL (CAAX protease family)
MGQARSGAAGAAEGRSWWSKLRSADHLPLAVVLALLVLLAVLAGRGSGAGVRWTALSLLGALAGSILAGGGTRALLDPFSNGWATWSLWGSSLGLAAVALLGLRRVGPTEPASPAPMGWGRALGLACWYTVAGGARLGILLAPVLRIAARGTAAPDELTSMVQGAVGAPALALLAVPIVLFGPIGEELAFRGLLQPALARRWGRGVAIAVTAILFAALHWHYGFKLPQVLFLGAVLGWARVASGGLRAPILLHMLVNGASLLFLWRGGG